MSTSTDGGLRGVRASGGADDDPGAGGVGGVDGPDGGWRHPDGRSVLAVALLMLVTALAGGVPTVAGVASGGADPASVTATAAVVVGSGLLLVAAGAGVEHLRVRRTRFRIGAERVELHTGLVVRRRRGIARDRIRSVELTADPLLRVVGLVGVRVGTGQRAAGGESPVEIRAVRRADGERVRADLLSRPAAASAGATAGAAEPPPLATLDPRWVRFAPLSVLSVALGLAAGGVVLEGAGAVGVQADAIGAVGSLVGVLGPLLGALVLVAAVLVVGALASLGAFVEAWWGYRLDRETSGALLVRRGLLTRRSTTLEPSRLRGVALVAPLGVRSVGAVRVDAVATGLSTGGDQRSDPKGLLPAAPRDVAERVAAAVLGEPVVPGAALAAHPVVARGRRIRLAVAAALTPALVLAVLGLALVPVLLVLAAVAAVLGAGAGAAAGLLSYRALGHALAGPWLVVRSGVTSRRTVVLRRDSVIGVAVRSSPGQRRLGLVSVDVSTAAGDGRYTVGDVDEASGTALVAALAPGIAVTARR